MGAGAILFLFWGLVFVGIRLSTGKWPGQGAREHYNPQVYIGDDIDTGAYPTPSGSSRR